jgi:hypothetical protein
VTGASRAGTALAFAGFALAFGLLLANVRPDRAECAGSATLYWRPAVNVMAGCEDRAPDMIALHAERARAHGYDPARAWERD